MKLTDRVSVFFLAALGIALGGYSIAFYAVAYEHIASQFSDDLQSTLNSLIAAAEVEDTEVKWQPLEHSIDIAGHDEYGGIQWAVLGDEGKIVERSKVLDLSFQQYLGIAENGNATRTDFGKSSNSLPNWIVMQHQLFAPHPDRLAREFDEFDQLAIVVGRPTYQVNAILFRLALLVVALPLLGWIIAAFLGRWLVRKALRPVREMALQTRRIEGDDFHTRLSVRNSKDELEELGTAFNRLLDRQQNAYEQQSRFAGNAAHELRTPLTILLGQIEVALRRPRTEAEYRSTLELLKSDAKSLQEIVESLLFLARSDADNDPPPLRPMELNSWLESQSASWQASNRSADVRIGDCDSELQVRATPALLGRVIDNLVFNAMKYSSQGSIIHIRIGQFEENVEIEVSDSGFGIAENDIPHLFDPFFRTSEARQRGMPGNGLGLSIAQRIACHLGGTLTCKSKLGIGSTFTLRLPLKKD